MTKDELKELLGKAVNVLNQNADIATPQFLDTCQKTLDWVKTIPNIEVSLSKLLNITEDASKEMLVAFQKIIDMEHTLTENGTSKRITNALENLQNRPVILAAIAAFI